MQADSLPAELPGCLHRRLLGRPDEALGGGNQGPIFFPLSSWAQKCDVWLWKSDIKHSHVYLSLIIMQHGGIFPNQGSNPAVGTLEVPPWRLVSHPPLPQSPGQRQRVAHRHCGSRPWTDWTGSSRPGEGSPLCSVSWFTCSSRPTGPNCRPQETAFNSL